MEGGREGRREGGWEAEGLAQGTEQRPWIRKTTRTFPSYSLTSTTVYLNKISRCRGARGERERGERGGRQEGGGEGRGRVEIHFRGEVT